jgi:glycerophosphoryl diester phosphodiesterase
MEIARRKPGTARVPVLAIVAVFAVAASGLGAVTIPTRALAAAATPTPTPTKTTRPAARAVNPFRTGHTLIIAHAGGDALFPENTLYAYQRSTALGSEVVDIDVQMTADNVLIALHDYTLDRTTNGMGSVHSKKWSQVSTYDAGYRFKQGPTFPFRGKGLTIPTIESVLNAFPDSLVTLDLKDQRTLLVKPVCALITKLGRTETVYVGSDSNDQVVAFRKSCPQLHTSGTSAERTLMRAARDRGDTNFVTRQLVSQPRYIGDNGQPRVTAETLMFSHALNIAVLTWVVDDPAEMRVLVKLGVDGIYTRRPDILAKVINESR